ncbi:hypothetical protein Tco_0179190 [Tanacetum coccineum]
MIREMKKMIVQIKNQLLAARSRQKSYADVKRKPLEFEVGDKVMLKVSPWKGVVRFGKRRKLCPRYIGPFKILSRVLEDIYTTRIVMKNPNPLNEPNEAIPEENPVIPDPNQVVDVHDPNEMVDIPDDVDLVDYDGDDEENPKTALTHQVLQFIQKCAALPCSINDSCTDIDEVKTKTWLDELNEGTVKTWDELRTAFISRFFPPALFDRLLEEI